MLTSTPVRSKLNDSDVQAIPDTKGRIVRKSKYHPDKTRELLTIDESADDETESIVGIPSFSMNSSSNNYEISKILQDMGADSSVIESYEDFSNQLPPTSPYLRTTEVAMANRGNQASNRPPLVQIDTNLEDNSMIREYMKMRENQFETAMVEKNTRDENSIQSVTIIENNQNIVMTPQLKKYHQCNLCVNKYSTISSLHMHKKKKHKISERYKTPTSGSSVIIVCEICQKSFRSKAGLSTHTKWKHNSGK